MTFKDLRTIYSNYYLVCICKQNGYPYEVNDEFEVMMCQVPAKYDNYTVKEINPCKSIQPHGCFCLQVFLKREVKK